VSGVPRWARLTVGAAGLGCLALGALCFFAAPLLFGADAYRTLARVPIGLLGALSTGVGVAAFLASVRGDARGMHTLVSAMFFAATLVPPVVGFNIGAFDRIDTAGTRTLALVVIFVALVATPLHACLRLLSRLVKAGEVT
jgi:hypothetical protein